MKRSRKVLGWAFSSIIGIIILLVIYVSLFGNKTFDAPYPEIKASTDSLVIERGKYLVYGPAHCGSCHSKPGNLAEMDNGEVKPLVGGLEIDIPPVTMRAANLTPDKTTGIGGLTDGQIARSLRYGIGYDGRLIMPVMEYSQMSDEDLTAIISYLRSQPPVNNHVEPSKFKFLGKALLAFGILKAKMINTNPPINVPKDNFLTYGQYLSTGVANCMGCHTNIDVLSGLYTVPPFAGGFYFEGDALTNGFGYVSPNITPDTETGIMTDWTEDEFLDRFNKGRVHRNSPMPWGSFTNVDSSDLKAIFHYLSTLDGVYNPIPKIVIAPGEKLEH